jgi:hypothetical protein
MSKVVIAGDASGTGTFTISAPNGNTDRTLTLPDEAGTVLTSAGVPASAMPAGSVLQVVQGYLGTTASASTSNDTTVDTGLQASITPSSASSKILVQYNVFLGQQDSYNMFVRILRDSTYIGNGTSEGGRPVGNAVANNYHSTNDGYSVSPTSNVYLDSPNTTSSITYKIQMGCYGGNLVYINRSHIFQASAGAYDTIPLSTITLMEIAA